MKKLITLLSALTLFTTVGSAITETTNVASAKTVHHKKKKIAKKKKTRKRVTKKRKKVAKKRVVKKRKVVKKKVVKKATPKNNSNSLINTSNKPATPLKSTDGYNLTVGSLTTKNVKNIVSSEKNLPNKIPNSMNKNGSWNQLVQKLYYVSNSIYDKSERINPKKLTRAQLTELNKYANTLITNYRKAVKNKVTPKTDANDVALAMKMAQARAAHNVDSWNAKYDSLAIPENAFWATQQSGDDYPYYRYYENGKTKDVTTMLQLKVAMYNALNSCLNENDHTRWELLTCDSKDDNVHFSVGVQYRSQILRKKDPKSLLTFIFTTSLAL